MQTPRFVECLPLTECPRNVIVNGDTLRMLRVMPAKCIDMVITSPPYYGLRNYGIDGQIGSEPTYTEYLDKMIAIFAEVKRVLKDTGSCWVNLGDTYNGNKGGNTNGKYRSTLEGKVRSGINEMKIDKKTDVKIGSKSLLCIPDRFKIRMIDELGFICRNDLIWYKPNSMPQSAKDRFGVDYERIFFFTKQAKYFFEPQYNPLSPETLKELEKAYNGKATKDYANAGAQNASSTKSRIVDAKMQAAMSLGWQQDKQTFTEWYTDIEDNDDKQLTLDGLPFFTNKKKQFDPSMGGGGSGFKTAVKAGHIYRSYGTRVVKETFGKFDNALKMGWQPAKETYAEWYFAKREKKGWHDHSKDEQEGNMQRGQKPPVLHHPLGSLKRSVWRIPVRPFAGAHFAVFPPQLIETPILAGCPSAICAKCGHIPKQSYARELVNTRPGRYKDMTKKSGVDGSDPHAAFHQSNWSRYRQTPVQNPVGLETCACDAGYSKGIVLDPFMGSGTVALVAQRLGRDWLGIEIKPEYVVLAHTRLGI